MLLFRKTHFNCFLILDVQKLKLHFFIPRWIWEFDHYYSISKFVFAFTIHGNRSFTTDFFVHLLYISCTKKLNKHSSARRILTPSDVGYWPLLNLKEQIMK